MYQLLRKSYIILNFLGSAPEFCALRPIPFIRHSAIRRDAVDEAREMLAKLRQEVVGRHARLAGHGLHLILAETVSSCFGETG